MVLLSLFKSELLRYNEVSSIAVESTWAVVHPAGVRVTGKNNAATMPRFSSWTAWSGDKLHSRVVDLVVLDVLEYFITLIAVS